MQPLPFPTHGDALEPFLIPTILPSYMLVHTNHPSFSTLSFTTIRHLYLPTCTRAPSYIQYIPCGPHPSLYKPWPNSTAITHPQPKGSSGAIAHPPLCTTIPPIAHPQPRGNLWTHSPSLLTLSNPKLQQWATDP